MQFPLYVTQADEIDSDQAADRIDTLEQLTNKLDWLEEGPKYIKRILNAKGTRSVIVDLNDLVYAFNQNKERSERSAPRAWRVGLNN
jgi:hypothetical protein